jgi:hypothetical protein
MTAPTQLPAPDGLSARMDYESHATSLDSNEAGALLLRPGPPDERRTSSYAGCRVLTGGKAVAMRKAKLVHAALHGCARDYGTAG